MIEVVSNIDIDQLVTRAQGGSRLRKNLNIHKSYSERCQKLFNSIDPNSYIRPHRHSNGSGPETLLAVRGSFVLFLFCDAGEILEVVPFSLQTSNHVLPVCVTIHEGVWHTVLSLEDGGVLFEVKSGPFLESHAKEMAPWAPEEGSFETPEYLNMLRAKYLKKSEQTEHTDLPKTFEKN